VTEEVKSTRRYDSPRRREQAAATRGEILEAAERLFERQGYAATTMTAIAAEAGVALKTVYVAFETKSGVLRALWHLRLRGDQKDVPMPDRTWYHEVLDEPDPEAQLRLTALNSRLVKERIAPLLGVIRGAAPLDPDIEALWGRIQTEFYGVLRGIVASLEAKQALRPGLGVDRASDLLWTLNHPDVWRLLVTQCRWSPARYERWLAAAFCSHLLADSKSAG
jgi:AcrR family transcriptional regulator